MCFTWLKILTTNFLHEILAPLVRRVFSKGNFILSCLGHSFSGESSRAVYRGTFLPLDLVVTYKRSSTITISDCVCKEDSGFGNTSPTWPACGSVALRSAA